MKEKQANLWNKIGGVRGAVVGVLLVLLVGWLIRRGGGDADGESLSFTVRQGNLPITVVEGGSIEALESQEIRSEIKGYQGTKILSIVDEGYLVTEEDLENKKILVELDSSEIRQKIVTQEIQFQSTVASLTEARNARDIQVNQNLSDVKAADLKVKFARMDVEKFLGAEVTQIIFRRLGLREPARIDVTVLPKSVGMDLPPKGPGTPPPGQVPGGGGAAPEGLLFNDPPKLELPDASPLVADESPAGDEVASAEPAKAGAEKDEEAPAKEPADDGSLMRPTTVVIDYSEYADKDVLGDGEAQQKIRQAEDEWLVAKTDLGLAETKLAGTKRLFGKGFVTQNQLDNDSVSVEKARVRVEAADTARKLFQIYEFPKTAEELVSKYEEALLGLDKTQKEAISKLAQAEAKFKSAQGRYSIEQNELSELEDQLSKTKIYAEKTGLVTYGGNRNGVIFYGEEQIREGATVRQRQAIITIPDMTKMGVHVKIHESYIKKIKAGMEARIRVEAFPDRPIEGEVTKVGVLPDSQNRWMNPDLKVYKTTIKIEGVKEWLKPGMTAKVEIIVDQLEDVIFVPIQAVFTEKDEQVCYLSGRSRERRPVKTGAYNDEYIQILEGLEVGESVVLKAPSEPGSGGDGDSGSGGDGGNA